LKNIQHIRSRTTVAFFLATIPEMLPKGAWIKNFNIVYAAPVNLEDKKSKKRTVKKSKKSVVPERKKTRPAIILEGYVYLDNIKEQFGRVNQILRKLKSNEKFSEFFENITLEAVEAEVLEDYSVASFFIKCQ